MQMDIFISEQFRLVFFKNNDKSSLNFKKLYDQSDYIFPFNLI